MTDPQEEWRAVPRYGGRYEVSSLGRVRSLFAQHGHPRAQPLVMKQRLDRYGYYRVQLAGPDGPKLRQVHFHVCEAFNGPRPSPQHVAAHSDGSRTENRPGNLRWATAAENVSDRAAHGRTTKGVGVHTAKMTEADVRRIRASPSKTCAAFAEELGVSDVAVSYARSGKTWSHV